MTDDITTLRQLTHCGCGDQFSRHDPGTCGACVAAMGRPAAVPSAEPVAKIDCGSLVWHIFETTNAV